MCTFEHNNDRIEVVPYLEHIKDLIIKADSEYILTAEAYSASKEKLESKEVYIV